MTASGEQLTRKFIEREKHALKYAKLFGWMSFCLSIGVSGSFFPPDDWYVALNRPSICPPDYIFGPVWVVLYVLMGISIWRYRNEAQPDEARWPTVVFVAQLIANGAWSLFFFGLHRIDLALLNVVVMILLLVSTMFMFFKRSVVASALLIPYLAWVGFAMVLTYEFQRLNP